MLQLSEKQIEQRLETFPSKCRQAGLRVTQQRALVYSALATTNMHPTAEEVQQRIVCHKDDLPSLGTVYKILDAFCSKDIIRKVATKEQAARYDANCLRHQHLHCSHCDGLFDFEMSIEPVLKAAPESPFEIHNVQIVCQGLCTNCQSKPRTALTS